MSGHGDILRQMAEQLSRAGLVVEQVLADGVRNAVRVQHG